MKKKFIPCTVREDYYFRLAQLNEMMLGQTKEQTLGIYRQYNKTLHIDFSNYYICLSGFNKPIYDGVYGVDTSQYMNTFLQLEQDIMEYFYKVQCMAEVFLFTYGSKELVVVFSPSAQCTVPATKMVETISSIVQENYQKAFLPSDAPYFPYTVLSSHLTCYEELAPAFCKLRNLYRLRFFEIDAVVITAEIAEQIAQYVDYEEVLNLLRQMGEAVARGDAAKAKGLCRTIFLDKLKPGYDFSLCEDIVSIIKRGLYRYNTMYDLRMEQKIEDVCNCTHFLTIDEMQLQTNAVISFFAYAISSRKALSYIIQESIRFIKNNYFKDVSLTDVAQHVHVVPNYLSRRFNHEIKMSIPAYINMIRMEKAKLLLTNTNLRIHEIAQQVGIGDAHHFGLIFKKMQGMTATQYRKNRSAYQSK